MLEETYIVHNVAIRIIQEESCDQIKIKGLLTIHPAFGGKERTEKERTSREAKHWAWFDLLWKLSLPEGSNHDHPWCNFAKSELSMDE